MEKPTLSGVPETMLQTLYARARESESENAHIHDDKAVEIVSSLDYDFSKAESDKAMTTGVIARTILLDRMTREYLEAFPDAVVINIACGLDTRCYRFKGRYSRWYNLDLPETMAVRKRFLPENEHPIYQIEASVIDPLWPDEIKLKDEHVLVIIEGLSMYLDEYEVEQMFSIIGRNFPEADVYVETMNPFVVKHFKEKSIEGSKAKFRWGVRNGRHFERIIPDYISIKDITLAEGMKEFIPVYRILSKLPGIKDISNKILVLKHR